MFCVACIIFAFDAGVQFAIALHFTSRIKKSKAYKDVCVLTRFDLSNMDCICVVSLFMICAHGIAVTFAIALLFMSRNKHDMCVLTRFDFANMGCICFV